MLDEDKPKIKGETPSIKKAWLVKGTEDDEVMPVGSGVARTFGKVGNSNESSEEEEEEDSFGTFQTMRQDGGAFQREVKCVVSYYFRTVMGVFCYLRFNISLM